MPTFLKESVLQGTKVEKPLVFSMPLILQSKTKSLRGPVTSQRTCGLLTVKPVWQVAGKMGTPFGRWELTHQCRPSLQPSQPHRHSALRGSTNTAACFYTHLSKLKKKNILTPKVTLFRLSLKFKSQTLISSLLCGGPFAG